MGFLQEERGKEEKDLKESEGEAGNWKTRLETSRNLFKIYLQ